MIRFLNIINLFLIISSSYGQDISISLDQSIKLFEQKKHSESIQLLHETITTHNDTEDSQLVESYLLLAKNYMHSWKSTEALEQYRIAYDLSKKIENDSLQTESGTSLLSLLSLKQKSDSILIITKELFAIENLHHSVRSHLNTCMASYYEKKEQLDSTIYYATIATKIDSMFRDSSSLPFSYFDLGIYYSNDYDYTTGISKILYGMQFLRGEKDSYKRTSIEIGLSDIYYRIGNMTKAEEYALNALESAKKLNHQINQCNAYYSLGHCSAYKEDFEKALSYYEKSDSVNQIKSKNIWRSVRAKTSVVSQKLNLNIPVSESEIKEIQNLCEDTETDIIKNKLDFLLLRVSNYSRKKFDSEYNRLYIESKASKNAGLERKLLKIKKEYLIQNKDYQEALAIDSKIDKMKKDIIKNNNKYIIQDLEAKHVKKEQDIQISYLDQQNTDKELLLKEQSTKIIYGSIALGLIALLSFFLFRLYHKIRAQKEIISKSLQEKDLLLREIHHRVKNNLQLVSSLLTLQGRSIDDATTIQAINEGKSRVRSMALIHQDLYNKENITGVSVKEYIEKLSLELFDTYNISNERISLVMEIDDIELDIDTIVPLGLIINELITNSLKYAWPDDSKGVLEIRLKQDSNAMSLTVKDDGIGYDPLSVRKGSFGATLISALTLQLDGECKVTTDNGSTVTITIDNSQVT